MVILGLLLATLSSALRQTPLQSNVGYQIHSQNDLGSWKQTLSKGARWLKIDPHYMPVSYCAQVINGTTSGCLVLSHDTPSTPFTYNTTEDLLRMLADPGVAAYFQGGERGLIAMCFKWESSYGPICNGTEISAAAAEWVQLIDDFYQRANALILTGLHIEFVMDGDATSGGTPQRTCLINMWNWTTTWIVGQDPLQAAVSNQHSKGFDAFQVNNMREGTPPAANVRIMQDFGYGKFMDSNYSFLLWEPDKQEDIWDIVEVYQQGPMHPAGFRFASNTDSIRSLVFAAAKTNESAWNLRLPLGDANGTSSTWRSALLSAPTNIFPLTSLARKEGWSRDECQRELRREQALHSAAQKYGYGRFKKRGNAFRERSQLVQPPVTLLSVYFDEDLQETMFQAMQTTSIGGKVSALDPAQVLPWPAKAAPLDTHAATSLASWSSVSAVLPTVTPANSRTRFGKLTEPQHATSDPTLTTVALAVDALGSFVLYQYDAPSTPPYPSASSPSSPSRAPLSILTHGSFVPSSPPRSPASASFGEGVVALATSPTGANLSAVQLTSSADCALAAQVWLLPWPDLVAKAVGDSLCILDVPPAGTELSSAALGVTNVGCGNQVAGLVAYTLTSTASSTVFVTNILIDDPYGVPTPFLSTQTPSRLGPGSSPSVSLSSTPLGPQGPHLGMISAEDGYCYLSHSHNTRAQPTQCQQQGTSTPGVLTYTLADLADWEYWIGDNSTGPVTSCTEQFQHGSYDMGSDSAGTLFIAGNVDEYRVGFAEMHRGVNASAASTGCGDASVYEGVIMDGWEALFY